jgi:DNA-directed RNA polymerase specialized sigma24 family protein
MRIPVSGVTPPASKTRDDNTADFQLPCDEICECLRIALRDLQPEAKVVFLLRQNSGLAYEEIARMLRCPVDTVKARMRLALRDLRKVLNESCIGVRESAVGQVSEPDRTG